MSSDLLNDSRLYCDYRELIRLKGQASSFTLLPQFKSGSVLSGRHGSRFRGRGLNFEELRHYNTGDDIRNLDWNVTLRTGKPHIRVYSEEKDYNVILCVDQNSGMFFSSVNTMKSVIAVELATLCAWRILEDNDRIGLLITEGEGVKWCKPVRSQKDFLNYLSVLCEVNNKLSALSVDSNQNTFSGMVDRLVQLKMKNSVVVIFSDWYGAKEKDLTKLKHLQIHNDVLGVLISDPYEKSISKNYGAFTVTDGQYQLSLDSHLQLSKANQSISEKYRQRVADLTHMMAIKNLPLVQVSTDGQHISQFKKAMGGLK
ncbi:DUF58 domain-containing protein [Vibrio sp. HN007]|uniref:DUF58 domain-containing protein n=1 Tax=Vibrio iocasae TaxID=3098914 RepID=UPI0035D4A845